MLSYLKRVLVITSASLVAAIGCSGGASQNSDAGNADTGGADVPASGGGGDGGGGGGASGSGGAGGASGGSGTGGSGTGGGGAGGVGGGGRGGGGAGGASGAGGAAGAGGGASLDAGSDGPAAYPLPVYQKLSETGLYEDIGAKQIASGVSLFQPAHQLWSDGAEKRRWLKLPPGTKIDTTDMDHWRFPIGTKVWKEFSRGGVLLETRLIERYGPDANDYFMSAFVWAADRSDATVAPDGAANVNGTTHDVPLAEQCGNCHRGEPGRVLGVSAIQLSHAGAGLTLASLAAANLLSQAPPANTTYPVPGDAATSAALGYIHANCGHCHIRNGTSWFDTKVIMRLRVAERVANETDLWKTLVGKPLDKWVHATITDRVVPGNPAMSAVIARMMFRGGKDQMPPLATEMADTAAIGVISNWITSLPTTP